MSSIRISDFGCIKDANITLSSVNVIIGPQGSGKSLSTKLMYFCCESINNISRALQAGDSLTQYKESIERQFYALFPSSAWGGGRFRVHYTVGDFYIRILRRVQKGTLSDKVSIKFSENFEDSYQLALSDVTKFFLEMDKKEKIKKDDEEFFDVYLERANFVQSITLKTLAGARVRQTFVPAGRAFFTTLGKLVAGFEQGAGLDPITLKFARVFSALREQAVSPRFGPGFTADRGSRRGAFVRTFFGGVVRMENDIEIFETNDGRKIPFSALSSGQQELFPMWVLIDSLMQRDERAVSFGGRVPIRRRIVEQIFIEEPEAHLFPQAQGLLLEYLVGLANVKSARRRLIFTTHSPYVMAKMNLFLKAGQLSRKEGLRQQVAKIVPQSCWIKDDQVAAFAIEGNKVRSILEDGIINAQYIDGISEEISAQYEDLLAIEMRQ